MKYKNHFSLIAIFILLILGCKKEQQISGSSITGTSIIGLWEVKLLTITQYDSFNNVIKTDTVIYTNDLGEPVTVFEKYTSDNKFFLFQNSTNDTLKSTTFTQTGKNISINLPDNVFPFNNRTISKVDSTTLELYQLFNNGTSQQKWTQKYIRK